MKLEHLPGASTLAVLPMAAATAPDAAELPLGENCADSMTISSWGGFVVPADLPESRPNRVKHLLWFATGTQQLADQAKYISYGPAHASSQPLVSTHAERGIEMVQHMPAAPENAKTGVLFNYKWWADHRDEHDARFQSWPVAVDRNDDATGSNGPASSTQVTLERSGATGGNH